MTGYGASFEETLRALGERARQLRLLRALAQSDLATRAGVSLATIHRFEKRGTASLENVLRIASALEADTSFDQLFALPAFRSIDEALARPRAATRRRAPRQK